MNQMFLSLLPTQTVLPTFLFYQKVVPFCFLRNKITFLSHLRKKKKKLKKYLQDDPRLNHQHHFLLHPPPPLSSLSHIPDLILISLRVRKFATRGVAVGQAGRVLSVWYCNCCEILLDGQEVIPCLVVFFFSTNVLKMCRSTFWSSEHCLFRGCHGKKKPMSLMLLTAKEDQ